METIEIIDDEETINFNFENIPQSGKVVARLENVSKSYDEMEVLKNINLQIDRGDKIAVIGLNGSGKSTLAKILANVETITSGKKSYGHNVLIGYYSQNLIEELDLEQTVLESVELIDPEKPKHKSENYLGVFSFKEMMSSKKLKFYLAAKKVDLYF